MEATSARGLRRLHRGVDEAAPAVRSNRNPVLFNRGFGGAFMSSRARQAAEQLVPTRAAPLRSQRPLTDVRRAAHLDGAAVGLGRWGLCGWALERRSRGFTSQVVPLTKLNPPLVEPGGGASSTTMGALPNMAFQRTIALPHFTRAGVRRRTLYRWTDLEWIAGQ